MTDAKKPAKKSKAIKPATVEDVAAPKAKKVKVSKNTDSRIKKSSSLSTKKVLEDSSAKIAKVLNSN